MKSEFWLKLIAQHRAIAIIRAPQIELGEQMAHAVAAGGVKLIEITWNSDRAAELIDQLKTDLPDCTIGTGTVLNLQQLRSSIQAGAEFIFTPHVNLSLIQAAIAQNIPIIPGALTPTEIVTAWQAGASSVKVFPVHALGGASYIQSLQAAIGQIPLIPTGGVTVDNAPDLVAAGAIAVGLAGNLLSQRAIQSRDWRTIERQARILVHRLQSV
ncbi:MAG: bifunctional 4-hydroxy-2-oxoglutarate aldolase/2-dehydro-3-deoxy-phosphogluconate aldolase [Leptolyngbyaceae cyanobacterium CSU_1_3]|nr:bifunctional 4-hydroxy-2-oxoglutarate aldolase/2-dehydro-3-deoxy-phosphogluconate aldolase [Leptolyngbyaceae cyanobacterium CSU_1_3]